MRSPARCSASSTWAVLALTCHIELFVQAHYRASIEHDDDLSELWKDVFLFHWREESQHAVLDEIEWQREDAKLTPAERDAAVDDLIALVGAVDGILQARRTPTPATSSRQSARRSARTAIAAGARRPC